MKVAVTSTGSKLEAAVDPRFGRCSCFVLVATDDMSFETTENESSSLGGGAGIQSAQLMAHMGAIPIEPEIAVPVTDGVLSSHFGHCEQFVLFDVERDGKAVGCRQVLTPPPHELETFPKWLHEEGATVIIAGGMGSRAQSLFDQNGIHVVVGASSGEPDALVRDFLDDRLTTGANVCDH